MTDHSHSPASDDSTLVNNIWAHGQGEPLVSTSPDGRNVLWHKRTSSGSQVLAAVHAARLAQPAWSALPLSQRIALLNTFAEILKQREDELASAISLETGKPLWEAMTEVGAMINKVALSVQAQQDRAGARHDGQLHLNHHGHGVMAVFGPFNFPGHLPNGHIVPALLAGNTVVFKPSEQTPWVAELTTQAWIDAGLPPGVVNLVQGARDVGEALVGSDLAGILFTGSHTGGRAIHRQLAGRPEVMLALEMGGNNPLVVGEFVADNVAASTILHSAFLSAGQRCTCARRLILQNTQAHKDLLDKVIELARRIVVNTGDNDNEAFMGPVISMAAAEQLLTQQESLLAQGAVARLTLRAQAQGIVYLRPGIIDVSAVANLDDEELFGPLLQVSWANSFSEALDKANDTRFGLAAGLISDSEFEQQQFRQTVRAGVISINLPTAGASSALPFGGVGASGNHRPSAWYAADYCAWPQALSFGAATAEQAKSLDLSSIRGLR